MKVQGAYRLNARINPPKGRFAWLWERLRILAMFLFSVAIGALVFIVGMAVVLGISDGTADIVILVPMLAAIVALMAAPVVGVLAAVGCLLRRRLGMRPVNAWVAGATLGLATYLVWVVMGVGEPSDRPMTFAENIRQPIHVLRSIMASIGGAAGWGIFRKCV